MSNSLVEIKDIHKSFGSLEVLKGVDFSVDQGEVVCLIGKSGSGKSTLAYLLEGNDPHYRGEILINNKPLKDINQDSLKKHIIFS